MEIRIRVALAVLEHNQILLVPHYRTDVSEVQWTIPGGKVEFGESLQAAALREFSEETGLQAEIIDLLDTSEVIRAEPPYHSITISFLGRVTGGEIRSEANHPYGQKIPRWFSRAELDGLNCHPARTVAMVWGAWYLIRRGCRAGVVTLTNICNNLLKNNFFA
jgi:8-oxo-dGTP diphosphatase